MFRYGFKKRLQELGVDYGASMLAAVSGGVDSMCMVDALLHSQLDLQIAVAHVNFNLRGEESDADTRMVEQWCTEHNITLYQESFNTTEFAQQEGISIEMAARDLRYNWFYTLMQEHGFNFLAIAHNANDNAETLLLNLTRGCGIEGIAGIREKVLLQFQEEQEEQQEENQQGSEEQEEQEQTAPQYIIRPLLCYSRQQIEKYAFKFKVPYRTDSTNLLSDYSRNRIRNEVFPQLEKINPSVIATFNRNIKHFQQAGAVLQRAVEEKYAALCHEFPSFQELQESRFSHSLCGLNLRMNLIGEEYSQLVGAVCLEELMAEPEWEFWVYQIASRWGFVPSIIGNICKSLEEEEGPKKFLSGSGEIIAVKERGLLKFYLNVPADGCGLQIDTTLISRENWRTRKEAGELCPTLYMDAAKLEMPLSCRVVAPGDRFSPLGLRGSKKVTDYLTDIKFENLHKGNVLVMCDASGKIVCLPGLQISNHVRVTESTSEILQVRVL
ncbi:MAG: tRNA lysidine(34) synthetase TilS [Bacteroidales bacterium]|nr:tRNA lysidine(34) synthetase TilS [Bacteroidales bacterium]